MKNWPVTTKIENNSSSNFTLTAPSKVGCVDIWIERQ